MTEGESARRGAWTLVATGLGLFMIFLDASIVNVALPDMQRDFEAGESGIQWVVAGYSLTLAMFIMSSATFADRKGRRLAYIVGLVVFAGASLACALATDIGVLAVARGVQGGGAALVNVASLALVGAAYPDKAAKAKAIGIWTGIAAVGFALGPTLGGVLTETIGWRSIFLVNPVVAGIAVALSVRVVDESRDPTPRGFDVPGQLLFIGGIGALTFALIEAPVEGWLSPIIVGAFVIGIALMAFFVRVELRARDPMMDVRVFADRVYSSALYAVFAVLFCVYGTLFLITQYFQNVRAYSPEEAGILMLAMSVPTMIVAPISGRLVAARGGRGPTLLGIGFAAASTGVLAVAGASALAVTLVGLALAGLAGGLAVAAATSIAMGAIPTDRSGMASGILSAQRGLGSTAGFAVMGSILAATVSLALPDRLEPSLPNASQRERVVAQVSDDANPQAVVSLIGPAKPVPDSVRTRDAALDAADDVFVSGIRIAMVVGFVVALSALVIGWFTFPRFRDLANTSD